MSFHSRSTGLWPTGGSRAGRYTIVSKNAGAHRYGCKRNLYRSRNSQAAAAFAGRYHSYPYAINYRKTARLRAIRRRVGNRSSERPDDPADCPGDLNGPCLSGNRCVNRTRRARIMPADLRRHCGKDYPGLLGIDGIVQLQLPTAPPQCQRPSSATRTQAGNGTIHRLQTGDVPRRHHRPPRRPARSRLH